MVIGIVVGLLVLVLSAVPVAAVLGILSFVLDEVAMDGRLTAALAEIYWDKSKEFILVAVPMFILLGEIMLRAGIARRMYGAVIQWLSWLPGGLMHANIGSCTIFAASSGSSVATAATVGTVAYPEIEKRKYNERLFLGSLAAGGTLGILVPPSINLIIYGLLTDTSVPELYLAGIFPGLMLAGLFMVAIIGACIYRPSWGGVKVETNWTDRIRTLPDLLPPIVLFTAVVGSIYAGIATPTEAASIGVMVALIIAASFKSLNFKMLRDSFEGTMRTTAMIMLIVFAAIFLNFVLGFMGITQAMLAFIADMGLTPIQTIYLIVAFYLLLGMFMETLSMMLTTIPIVFPIVMKLGVPEFSDVWFGILITLLMEAALITPPIGVNLYVVQGIRTRGGKFNDVAIGAIPFVVSMLFMIVILISWPSVATWLPNQVYH
ncbi:MAG: TRAP transporter large permease [Rhodospirillaceae bacterium]|jgi:C4-dicarboxylate transporter, DctM subunit|nr:TRAP transporter large permease [Rhodospirillaceae bacterium]MBT4687167.1 TRAP transporter large permease [Rhodospirillaceae bacterium]MBT5083575.1 TRAP transporter large permease [Rhodospirillaceae bacterium]MBT5525701.1 TRAP transporter large permease [Rhodospirillaceae bacterium]MBT5880460.1 TRAP transporter large permease [Rhodospirillaceae bacterium]